MIQPLVLIWNSLLRRERTWLVIVANALTLSRETDPSVKTSQMGMGALYGILISVRVWELLLNLIQGGSESYLVLFIE